MATIPYWRLQEKLKEIFNNDSRTALVRVEIETSLQPTIDIDKHVALYLKQNSRTPVLMGRGNNSRECIVEIDLECNTYHAGDLQQSFERRNGLLADIEQILQRKETLQTLQTIPTDTQIDMLEIITTTFETPQENTQLGFISRGIITINITVRA